MTASSRPPCDRCGQVHTKCTAHSKRHKGPCGAQPVKGQEVCAAHGGKSPQAVAAAARRETERRADEEIRKLWPGLAGHDPIKDPVDLLARTAGALEHMADVVGGRVNDLNGKVGGGKDLTQLRAEVTLLDRLLDKLLKAGDTMARLGIAERHVELEQARAQMVTAAFLGALEVLSGRVQLLPADRDAVVRAFLELLGAAGEEGDPR
ncbi:hypothetical protein [Pimelobacter simplex]|uniref:hypothetical protein n=1 Tax=Nocardioides simplex TaxID=2045 RepID=UPI00214F9C31|nr:hypothetical protein [Pimelobacter simplex]UUW88450.1 hypothetical protein M0M43_22285 [Pimelobacter simplex]UUW97954.1 hypothetical protein M0M48_10930 [Pimelobacter simplex]